MLPLPIGPQWAQLAGVLDAKSSLLEEAKCPGGLRPLAKADSPLFRSINRLLNAGSDDGWGTSLIEEIESSPEHRERFRRAARDRAVLAGLQRHTCGHACNSEQRGISDRANPVTKLHNK